MNLLSILFVFAVPLAIGTAHLIGTRKEYKNEKSHTVVFIMMILMMSAMLNLTNAFDRGYRDGQVDTIQGEIIFESEVNTVLKNDKVIQSDTTYVLKDINDYIDRFDRRSFF